MQLRTDGPFRIGRKWYSQFYATPEGAREIQSEVNGTHLTQGMRTAKEANHAIDDDLPFNQ